MKVVTLKDIPNVPVEGAAVARVRVAAAVGAEGVGVGEPVHHAVGDGEGHHRVVGEAAPRLEEGEGRVLGAGPFVDGPVTTAAGDPAGNQAVAGTFAALLAAPVHAADAKRPNFVFIYTDDQRWDAMSVVQKEMGDKARFPWFKTPNMDHIASEGVRFRNTFVVNSLCSPSRACFLSGQYSHANGVYNNRTPLSDKLPTRRTCGFAISDPIS